MTVEERLAYLEEQNEGLKRVGKLLMALCLLIGFLLVWTQSQLHQAVYSEALILGNSDNPRATLTTTPNNHLGLMFYDSLGLLPTEPKFGAIPYLDGFAIYDRAGKPRIVIGINDKDEALIDVVNPDGKVLFSAVPKTAPAGAPGANGAAGAPAGASGTSGAAATPAPSSGAAPTAAPTP
jgi:hypothetical protein